MPYLGIKDSKKRIVEYLIGLETLSNEKKRNELRFEERTIRQDWEVQLEKLMQYVMSENAWGGGVPTEPQVLELGISNLTNIVKILKGEYY